MSKVHVLDEVYLGQDGINKKPLATDDSSCVSWDSSPFEINEFSDHSKVLQVENRSPGPATQSCNVCRWVTRSVFLLLFLVGAAAGLLLAFRGTANPLDLFGHGKLPGVNETVPWDTHGHSGLNLLIANALEEKWTPYFEEYVSQWDTGSPDALTLTTTRIGVDPSCQPSAGILKVCNGDYGNTDWNGINLSLMNAGYIVSSVSKMNDYFLDGLTENDKRYTMCHEMGHGFGLAHTDENYSNANLGNCLDYSVNVLGNLSPGSFNYDLLAKVYGTVPPNRRLRSGRNDVPQSVMEHYQKRGDEIANSRNSACAHAGACVEHIGNGYTLTVHKLRSSAV